MHTTTAQLNKEQPIRKLGLKLKPSQCLVRGLATILKKKKSKTLEGNKKKLTTVVGALAPDNQNVVTPGRAARCYCRSLVPEEAGVLRP